MGFHLYERVRHSSVMDRLRSVGAEALVPSFRVFQENGSPLHHLTGHCAPGASVVELLPPDLVLDGVCSFCEHALRGSEFRDVLFELRELDDLFERVEMWKERVRIYSSEPLRMEPLLRVALECEDVLEVTLPTLLDANWVFGDQVFPLLAARFEEVISSIRMVLRTPAGREAANEFMLSSRMELGPSSRSCFVVALHRNHAPLAAALLAFGEEVAPGRVLVSGSALAVGIASGWLRASAVYLEDGDTPEVVATAAALWEPEGKGPLHSGMAALCAARELFSAPVA